MKITAKAVDYLNYLYLVVKLFSQMYIILSDIKKIKSISYYWT